METIHPFPEAASRSGKTIAWVDRLLEKLFTWFLATRVTQTAGEVARECRDAMWEHVACRCRGMSPAQIRGYVAAISRECIWREVDVVLRRHRLGRLLRARVVDEARMQLVDLIADDVRHAELPREQAFRLVAA